LSPLPDIIVQEVSPRDGLQIEPPWVPTDAKVRLVDALSDLGFSRIEVSSFVSPKAVPALRDAAEVFARIRRRPGIIYVALAPNLRGACAALRAGADELNLVMSASDSHNLANVGMTGEASFQGFGDVARMAASQAALNGTVATAFGCPFEGEVPAGRVLSLVRRYLDLGMAGITLADTTGMANPRQVRALVGQVLETVGAARLTLHFHNTRGLGLANVLAAYEAGARRFDASLGGLGGCPFAPGASGNVCTEDLVNMAHEMGMATGLNLEGLIQLSRTLPPLLGHDVPGQVAKAGRVCDLHARPKAKA
jgi:hydroxymethylglutaryl-CoA lyase